MELLPGLGATLAIIPAILIALTQGSNHLALSNGAFTLIVIGYYVAVQQIENIVVAPRLMRRAVRLHPLVVILGFIVGGLSFGVLGAILATPVIASVKEIVSYLYLKIRGLPVEVDLPTQPSNPGSADPGQHFSLQTWSDHPTGRSACSGGIIGDFQAGRDRRRDVSWRRWRRMLWSDAGRPAELPHPWHYPP